ncbi:MAG: methyltransferase domain-containing protein [Gammaproteobacteria bacterium]|nr:methyltransferase domain-containing protein [Gammaproteobacteria bacterium]
MESQTHREVQRYYGETLESSDDLKTTACCTAAAPPDFARDILASIHPEVLSRYYGCGLVLPEALEGLRVLDLGCGAGRDVYLIASLVGADGFVVGVDMTPAQLAVARTHADYHAAQFGYARSNVDFLDGNIEQLDALPLAAGSFDLLVSNCVLNLAVDKPAVLRAAYRLLKPGGEMYFSDIYADRRLPAELAADPVLYGECLAGALYYRDFKGLATAAGFATPRLAEAEPVSVTDPELATRLGRVKFCSATYRLFKVAEPDAGAEDFGQRAIYHGTIPRHAEHWQLDAETGFAAGAETPVSRNTAALLRQSRFAPHFDLLGDDGSHLGAFGDNLTELPFSVRARSGCC